MIFVFGGPLLLAFLLLTFTKIGRVISLIIGAMLVVAMINGPAPDQRAEAMKAGTFDCKSALEDDTKFKDDVWSYCSGVYGGEAGWRAMIDARLSEKWDALAKKEADDKAAYEAKEAETFELGRRAAKR